MKCRSHQSVKAFCKQPPGPPSVSGQPSSLPEALRFPPHLNLPAGCGCGAASARGDGAHGPGGGNLTLLPIWVSGARRALRAPHRATSHAGMGWDGCDSEPMASGDPGRGRERHRPGLALPPPPCSPLASSPAMTQRFSQAAGLGTRAPRRPLPPRPPPLSHPRPPSAAGPSPAPPPPQSARASRQHQPPDPAGPDPADPARRPPCSPKPPAADTPPSAATP